MFTYWPGLGGPFLYDDYQHVVNNDNIRYFSPDLGGARAAIAALPGELFPRPLAKLSFALDYYFAGNEFSAFQFKRTNLLIHLLAGLLVLVFTRQLCLVIKGGPTVSRWLPLFTTSIWLLHPLQLTTTLYVVQRMTSMMAVLVLAGLILFTLGRTRLSTAQGSKTLAKFLMFLGVIGGTTIGVFFKENALLLPAYALILELTIFTRLATSKRELHFVKLFFCLCLGLPFLTGVLYLIQHPGLILDAYNFRNFSLGERLLTESRVLIYYFYLVLFPSNGQYSLYHDDFIISRDLLDPWTTLPALVFLIAGGLLSIKYRTLYPVATFGLLWFLVGHSLESTIIGLEIAWEHRNYLPSVGLIFSLTSLAWTGYSQLNHSRFTQGLSIALPVVLILLLGNTTHSLANIWSNIITYTRYNLDIHPKSCGAHSVMAAGLNLTGGDAREAYFHYAQCAELKPQDTTGLLEMRKLAAQVLYLAKQNSDAKDENLDYDSVPWNSPIRLNQTFLNQLIFSLNQEIERRFKSYPVTQQNVTSLSFSIKCATQRSDCFSIVPDLIYFIDIVLTREVPTPDRAILHYTKSTLEAKRGNINRAQLEMENAVSLMPDHNYLKLGQILQQLSMRNAKSAGELFDRFRQAPNVPPNMIRELEKEIDRAIALEKSGNIDSYEPALTGG